MLVSAFIIAALSATSVFGASSARLAERVARRNGQRTSGLNQRITEGRTNSTNAQLSENWSGAVWDTTGAVKIDYVQSLS